MSSNDAIQAPRAKLLAIDGLRAVACLMVLVFHCYSAAGQPPLRVDLGPVSPNVLRLVMFWNNGVTLFIVLSGFCIFMPLAAGRGERRFDFAKFMKRRCLRIIPAYYATILAALAWFPISAWLSGITNFRFTVDGAWPDGASLVAHIGLLHTIHADWSFDILGPFWSLGLEWQYYLVFPLAVLIFAKFGAARAVALLVGVTLSYRVVAALWLPTEVGVRWTYCSASILGRIGDFSLGMGLAQLYSTGSFQRAVSSRWLVLGVLLAGGTMLGGMKTAPFSPLNDLLWAIAFSFWVAAALGAVPLIRTMLSWGPLVWIGERSYSIYLLHMFPVLLFAPIISATVSDPIAVVGIVVASVAPVSLILAAAWYEFFERPFMARRSRSYIETSQRHATSIDATASRT